MENGILHCDLNGFFASVECLFNPELNKVPMAVSGNPENRHGIILAKNELAKKFGIQTAETIWQAKRKCPKLVLVRPRHECYDEYSRKVNAIYAKFTNRVEPFGIDESWLDVRGSAKLFGDGVEIADKIRAQIRETLGLTVSVGVSFNKVFAKLGSDYKKPDATTLISRKNFKEIIYPLPVSDMLFVGRKTADALGRIGIKTIGDLAAASEKMLLRRFGKHGAIMKEYAMGESGDEVAFYGDFEEARSIGNSVTYRRDILGTDEFNAALIDLADNVARRAHKSGQRGRVVRLQIKDPDFKTIVRQAPLDSPSNIAADIYECARKILMASWHLDSPVRMFGIALSSLESEGELPEQLSIFGEENAKKEKNRKMRDAIESVRDRFGGDIVKPASIVSNAIFSSDKKKKK